MTATHLRLVSETDRQPESLKFERRREPRHRIYARVTAVARDEDSGHEAGQIRALELVDQSDSGLGAWSISPVTLGSRVSVFFPAHGTDGGYDLVGRAVRCVPVDGGYHIGLHLESRAAAA